MEYTWPAPTARLYTGRPLWKPPSPGYTYPAWVSNALGGVRECIEPSIFVAGKTIAATLIDLLMQSEELEKTRAEFNDRTGGVWEAPTG